MLHKPTLALLALTTLANCSDINPYDRSEYKEAETPIAESTNHEMVADMNAAPKVDPSKPFATSNDENSDPSHFPDSDGNFPTRNISTFP